MGAFIVYYPSVYSKADLHVFVDAGFITQQAYDDAVAKVEGTTTSAGVADEPEEAV